MPVKQNIKIAVDAIVFGYQNEQLFVLLIKQKFGVYQDRWSLPGGFLHDDESLTEGVKRELQEETGIKVDYLEQLFTFGDDIKRDPRSRVISVAYFALSNPRHFNLKADTDSKDVKWFETSQIPNLPFDHNKMINLAYERLKSKLLYQPIGFDLLNKEFPFADLEQLYMTILDRKIDRRNFRKKMLSFGVLTQTNKVQKKKGGGRPAKLFVFNQKKYRELERDGFHFEVKFV